MPFQIGHKGFRTKESYANADKSIFQTEEYKLKKSLISKSLGLKPPHPSTFSEETKRKQCEGISRASKGRKLTPEWIANLSKSHLGQIAWNKGIHHTKISGKNHYLWKGTTPENKRQRESLEYKIWRTSVFERDKYTCIWCGDNRGRNLEADHIKPFAYFPELRFEISNGRTLCNPCHRKTDTWGFSRTVQYE